MALKTLELKKQIEEQRKLLEAMEQRKASFATREAELAEKIETADAEQQEAITADVEAFNAEKADAETEELNLRNVIAELEKELEEAEENQPSNETKITERKIEKMEIRELRASTEYRDAFVKYVKTEDATEIRSLLTENASGGTIPVPTIVDEIVKTAWENEDIMALVGKSYIKGNIKLGFEISATGAVVHTEGAAAPDEQQLVIGTKELLPVSIKKWVTFSDEVMDMEGEAFLRYIYAELVHHIAKKAADEMVGAIVTSPATSSTTAPGVPQLTKAPAVDTVAAAMGLLSDEARNTVVIMNKATWSAFKAIQYGAGYAIDPFEGMKVVFNNSLPAYSAASAGNVYMIVGDLGNGARANFPAGSEIKIKLDETSLAEKDLVKAVGRMFVALGVVAPNHFVNVKKPA